jgi:hypothetical protein
MSKPKVLMELATQLVQAGAPVVLSPVQQDALGEVLDLDVHVWFDLGPKLTCREAEALMGLFESFEQEDAASALAHGHALGDEDGDEHFGGWDR